MDHRPLLLLLLLSLLLCVAMRDVEQHCDVTRQCHGICELFMPAASPIYVGLVIRLRENSPSAKLRPDSVGPPVD